MTSGVAYSSEEIERIKAEVIEWLMKTPMGTISEACSKAGIPYSSFWDWQNKDEELKALVKKAMRTAHEMGGDFAESKLRKKINDDDTTSILFYLKTRHKERGYVERQEQTGKDGKNLPAREFTIVIDKNSFMSDDTSTTTEQAGL